VKKSINSAGSLSQRSCDREWPGRGSTAVITLQCQGKVGASAVCPAASSPCELRIHDCVWVVYQLEWQPSSQQASG
jgi:hypothetical protein